MHKRSFVWFVFLLGLPLVACEEKGEEATPEAAPTAQEVAQEAHAEPAPAEVPGPAAICGQLVAAAKAGKEAEILALCTPGSAEALGSEGAKSAMMKYLTATSCGEVTVDGEKAMVAVTAGEESRELPFAMVGGAWKFDTGAYMEKYPPETAKPAEAKKKKKGKKKKGKKKKKQ